MNSLQLKLKVKRLKISSCLSPYAVIVTLPVVMFEFVTFEFVTFDSVNIEFSTSDGST